MIESAHDPIVADYVNLTVDRFGERREVAAAVSIVDLHVVK